MSSKKWEKFYRANSKSKIDDNDEFFIARRKFLLSLAKAAPVVDEITATLPELASYPIGVGVTTTANLASVLQTIPQMIAISERTTKSLADIAQSMSMPEMVGIGIAVGWNYIDALASIINGINLIMDEESYHQTQNKVKGVLSIISGAQAFAFSYNPALAATAGLGAATFAGPAFAFMTLADLVNASIDFYYASKEVTIEGWLDERVKEINFITERIKKLEEKNLNGDLTNKIDELKQNKQQLINDFKTRSKLYCYGNEEIALKERDDDEYQRRINFLNTKLDLINDNLKDEANFMKSPPVIEKPSPQEIEDNDKIQFQLEENYKEKRNNVIMKGLSFSGMTLLAIAPFTGPAAPALFVAGLAITLAVSGLYIYKHREKIHDTGKAILDKAKSLRFFEDKEEEIAEEPTEDPLMNQTIVPFRS